MRRISKSDSPLIRQFKRWAKGLLKVNPRYVTNPRDLVRYIKGPNWDAPDVEYAHYKETIGFYGSELLRKFEYIRSSSEGEAVAEYRALLEMAGIEEES